MKINIMKEKEIKKINKNKYLKHKLNKKLNNKLKRKNNILMFKTKILILIFLAFLVFMFAYPIKSNLNTYAEENILKENRRNIGKNKLDLPGNISLHANPYISSRAGNMYSPKAKTIKDGQLENGTYIKYLIKSRQIQNVEEGHNTEIYNINRKVDESRYIEEIIYSLEENLLNPDLSQNYIKNNTGEVYGSLNYDHTGDLRYVKSIKSKNNEILKNIDEQTKSSLLWIIDSSYFLSHNEKEYLNIKTKIFEDAFGEDAADIMENITDSDAYAIYQLAIWDLISGNKKDIARFVALQQNTFEDGVSNQGGIKREEYRAKLYSYILDKAREKNEYKKEFNKPNIRFGNTLKKINLGTVLEDVYIKLNNQNVDEISNFNIYVYVKQLGRYIKLGPKDYAFYHNGQYVLASNNLEYIKEICENNGYKETKFNILILQENLLNSVRKEIDNINKTNQKQTNKASDTNENIQENIDIEKINISLDYMFSGTIPIVYEPESNEYKSIVLVTKDRNIYRQSIDILKSEPDIALKQSLVKVNNIPITSKILNSSKIDVSELENNVNPTGKSKNAIYNIDKNIAQVSPGDKLLFNINVFNEGDISVEGVTITEYISKNLIFDENSNINKRYKWEQISEGILKTDILKDKKIEKAESFKEDQMKLGHEDIYIELIVDKESKTKQELLLLGLIEEYIFETGAKDRDESVKQKNYTPEMYKNLVDNVAMFKETKENLLLDDKIDYEQIEVFQKSDLALKTYISSIDGIDTGKEEKLINNIDTSNLQNALNKNGNQTDAKYDLSKEAVNITIGSTINLKLTVFNETENKLNAEKLSVLLPKGIELKKNSTVNEKNGWLKDEVTDRYIYSESIKNTAIPGAKLIEEKMILSKLDLDLELEVTKDIDTKNELKILSQIEKGSKIDRDSSFGDVNFKSLNQGEIDKYEPKEDDEDIEKIKVEQVLNDLALRLTTIKIGDRTYSSRVSNEAEGTIILDDIYNKQQERVLSKEEQTSTGAKYIAPKDALNVNARERIVLDISVFNEGQKELDAEKIQIYIPEGLALIDPSKSNINNKYGWNIVSKTGRVAETEYLKGRKIPALSTGRSEISKDILSKETINIELIVLDTFLKDNLSPVIAQIAGKNYSDRDSVAGNIDMFNIEGREYEFFSKYFEKLNDSNLAELDKYFRANEDDDDFEIFTHKEKSVDLALKKYISKLNGKNLLKQRKPIVDTKPLIQGYNDAKYFIPKNPVNVKQGDIVTYNINIFNEGDIDATANKISVYLPEGLGYIVESDTNISNAWLIDSVAVSKKLSEIPNVLIQDRDENVKINVEDPTIVEGPVKLTFKEFEMPGEEKFKLLKGFNGEDYLDYLEISLDVIVLKNENSQTSALRTIAEISEIYNKENMPDRDSVYGNVNFETYRHSGEEDDDDFEYLELKNAKMDFALKLITQRVWADDSRRDEGYRRERQSPKYGEKDFEYDLDKSPVSISENDKIKLSIRVYNEGDLSGYANKINVFLPEEIILDKENKDNIKYNWIMFDKKGQRTDNPNEARKISSDALSIESIENKGLGIGPIKAYDKSKGALNYHELPIVLKVSKTPDKKDELTISDKEVKVYAEIAEASDVYGNIVNDIDSKPNNLNSSIQYIEQEVLEDEKEEKESTKEKEERLEKTLNENQENAAIDVNSGINDKKNDNNNNSNNNKETDVDSNLLGLNKYNPEKDKQDQLEDDSDFEVFNIVKFDLSLNIDLKEAKLVDKKGNVEIKTKGLGKDEIHLSKRQLKNLDRISLEYIMEAKNIGGIPGYITEMNLRLPKGAYLSESSHNWSNIDEEILITNDIAQNLLNKDDTEKLSIVITKNISLVDNLDFNIEGNISKTYNEYNIDDITEKRKSITGESNNFASSNVSFVKLDIPNFVFFTYLAFYGIICFVVIEKIVKYVKLHSFDKKNKNKYTN